jgi:hypothetical protein
MSGQVVSDSAGGAEVTTIWKLTMEASEQIVESYVTTHRSVAGLERRSRYGGAGKRVLIGNAIGSPRSHEPVSKKALEILP